MASEPPYVFHRPNVGHYGMAIHRYRDVNPSLEKEDIALHSEIDARRNNVEQRQKDPVNHESAVEQPLNQCSVMYLKQACRAGMSWKSLLGLHNASVSAIVNFRAKSLLLLLDGFFLN